MIGRKRFTFVIPFFTVIILIIQSLSTIQVNANQLLSQSDNTELLNATSNGALIEQTVHTYNQNTWSYNALATGPNGDIYLAHMVNNTEIAIKKWNGTSWNSLPSVSTSATGDTSISGSLDLEVDSNGYLHLAFKFDVVTNNNYINSLRGVKYGVYKEGSWTFSQVEANRDSSGWKNIYSPKISIDSTGAAHLAYIYNDANNPRIYSVKYATNRSGNWSINTVSTGNSGTTEIHDPSIKVDSNDNVHLTYIKEDNQNTYYGNYYYVTKKATDANFSPEVKLIDSVADQRDYYISPIVVNDSGHVYFSYYDGGQSYLHTNASGTWKSELVHVDNARNSGALTPQLIGSTIYLLLESKLYVNPDQPWTAYDYQFFAMANYGDGWVVSDKNIYPPASYGGLVSESEVKFVVDSEGNYMIAMLDDGLRVISSIFGSSEDFGLITTPPAPTFNVTYDGNGNTAGNIPIDSNNYNEGNNVTVLANTGNLQKTGYSFAGWNTAANGSGTTYSASGTATFLMPANHVTLYAQWKPNNYTVTFDPTGGDLVTLTQKKLFGSTYGKGADGTTNEVLPIPTKNGYTFAGWYTEANGAGNLIVDSTVMSTPSDHTLYAKWAIKQYTVTFNVNGGSTVSNQTINHSDKVTKPADPTKVGHTFAGWFKENEFVNVWDFDTDKVMSDTTLYAKWTINQYTVTFNVDGGSEVTPITTVYNTTITEPTSPTKTGYTFAGWFKEAGFLNEWDFDADKVTEDTSLYAKWTINQYTVTFVVNSDSEVAPIVTDFNTTITEPTPPTKTGYTFAGWFKDATYTSSWNFDTDKVTDDTTLYAKWTINQYTVTFNTNRGTAVAPIITDHNTTISIPNNPFLAGYTFGGWYKDKEFTLKWDFRTDKVTEDITLYAKWLVYVPLYPREVTIQVEVETGDVGGSTFVTNVRGKRTINQDGTIKDEVKLSEETVNTIIETLKKNNNKIARIVLPNDDKVREIYVGIPKESTKALSKGRIGLQIYTNNVLVSIPSSSIATNQGEDLYFRIFPLTEEAQKIQDRLTHMSQLTKGLDIQMLGTPTKIETNMQSHPVTLTLPLDTNHLPFDEQKRIKWLDNLAIYVEHSDSSKELVKGKVITHKDGSLNIEFTTKHFSTFTVFYIEDIESYFKTNVHKAYINGFSDGSFRPNAFVTRAQMAAMLANNLHVEADLDLTNDYVDVPDTHWAARQILIAKHTSIMLGSGESFRPNNNITRAQMAMIVYRWVKQECGKNPNAYQNCLTLSNTHSMSYLDVSTNHWAAEAIHAIKEFNIMQGFNDDTFKPEDNLTRAQAVKVLNRLFKRGPLFGNITPSFTDVPSNHWAYREIEEAARNHRFTVENETEQFVNDIE